MAALGAALAAWLLLSPRGCAAAAEGANGTCRGSARCQPGVLLPVWQPDEPAAGDKAARAIVYFVAMMYLFLGVSIIADRFMASIEVITSREKEITVTKANGETSVGTVRIWNETVSNLTLMALGSSAPEILLSLIEVCGHRFQAGELGPGTIVGSAAFNMFVVIAVCVYAIPAGESRRIKHLRVFFVTASWSIFAYIWLYLILAVITPGVVQVWEAFLTLLFFPACVVFAWAADKRLLFYKYVYKRYRADPRSGIIIGTEAERPPKDLEADGGFPALPEPEPGGAGGGGGSPTPEEKELDESRREVIQILKDLKQKHPEKELEQLLDAANYVALVHQQKSRAFYRIQATRLMTGAGNVLKKHAAEAARRSPALAGEEDEEEEEDEACSRIFFEPCLYHCLENCGSVTLAVACQQGLGANQTFYVDFRTEDGSAKAGSDYEYSEGTLIFKPGETRKELAIGIIDDDIFEEDEHFFVRLLNLRVGDAEGMFEADCDDHPKGKLVAPLVATVTILDDDHAGIFGFRERSVRVSECQGHVEVTVVRSSGARGTVMVPFRTVEGTARGGGVDYEDASGELEFRNDETAKTLQVKIVDDEEYEKKENFFIELGTPRWLKRGISALLLAQGDGDRQLSAEEEEARRIADMGKPVLGDNRRLEVVIEESYDFKNTVDKLMKKTNLATVIGTHSWREQFLEAITVSAGDEDEDDEGREERLPSCFDYVMHFLTVFWKVLFACVPPTALLGGWAAFGVSILLLALLTALIGDLAAHFGCTLGLKDSVNAVVFVALGTSIPDTFASRVAALQDPCADASIGNVTGSNAVNVFLGLGLAWSVAAVYWAAQGRAFRVPPGTLAFPVTLFTIFAFLAIGVLLWRRRAPIGGELGGPRAPKILTAGLFLLLWLLYVVFASLEAYCHIQGF
uniref:Sodium/calcium exchanger 2-like n=1 Tax=Taeniopygia guttata TaxID=59729 RepID=A0A674GGQ7_TAEGU|nr:sodium/calcium exchanger 2 isoform X1 [Taeniopygia guttata]XP_041568407.1 sodium/calcium exchanger 2 isoform X2 [Taeniopygia guttata]XP_041568408.1 sodium/calcium exchanger 2 isoform X3 [Taeniopygia guttata]XP_041568409.1 sodium/calcium exchanger 2 isoform X4 [Taeniopygia guttata]